jgi:predicted amidohydrolase YtcJ
LTSRSADLILSNANVITCEPGQPTAQAVAVRDDRILRVGSESEMEPLKTRLTRTIDCRCQTLMPGFNDAHCHILSYIRKLFSLDLSPAKTKSIRDIQAAIQNKVKYTSPGKWISGTDYNEFYLAEKRHPTRLDLDQVSPLNPVILIHRSLHACVLSSLALKVIGIDIRSEEPPGGQIERDLESGEPNGILFEMLDYVSARIDSPLSEAELDWGLVQADRDYLSQGITSLGDTTATNNFKRWQFFQRIKDRNMLHGRINMMVGAEALVELRNQGVEFGDGDNSLRIGYMKIVLAEAKGRLHPSQDELNQMVLEANRAQFQVAIHAVEKTTVEAAIAALEFIHEHIPRFAPRQRIEHCSECPPELINRLKKLDTVVVSQPTFIYSSGERYLSQVAVEAQKWLYPFKSLLDAGLILGAGSDSPVAPNNPLLGIYAAVTRKADTGQTVLAEEAVSIQQALQMYTLNPAFATFEEKSKGSLAPGKLADMVLLDADPLTSPPEMIKDIRVVMTMVGGKVLWECENG